MHVLAFTSEDHFAPTLVVCRWAGLWVCKHHHLGEWEKWKKKGAKTNSSLQYCSVLLFFDSRSNQYFRCLEKIEVVFSRGHSLGSFVTTYLNIMSNNGDILEIQSSINLVHDVERSRLKLMQGKHKGQGAESLFSSRQVTDVFPTLLWRTNTAM